MEAMLTIRIDSATERTLKRLARERQTSRSDIVRQALRQFAAPLGTGKGGSVYSRVADLVGSVSSGRGDLSEHTGRRFSALLRSRPRR